MKIAVIGAGVSGMVCAYLLSEDHEVVMFEANDYIGGHTHTIDVPLNGNTYPVDTGFIVFNHKTYPNFIKLLKKLGVESKPSNMSFSVQCQRTGLTFSPSTLNALFAQRRNLFRPSFYRMLLDALRFRKESLELLDGDDYETTLYQYLKDKRYNKYFIEHFIIPMGDAIWSANPMQFEDFPARYFVEFFHNHGILRIRNQPQWLVVKGGSREYIKPLTQPYRDRIHLNSPVIKIHRYPDHVKVGTANGGNETFDHVVVATHSNQALTMLADPTEAEADILGSIPYQDNEAILHKDASLLPFRKAAWASWNYHIPKEALGRVAITYDMNILQSLGAKDEFCVTLNLSPAIEPDKIIEKMNYEHPLYAPKSLLARRRQDEITGVNRTYFCGAYWGYGFHEDGVNSALAVCKHFGKSI